MNTTCKESLTYPDRLRRFEKNAGDLYSVQSAVMKPFWEVHKQAVATGALETKMKELIALAISVSEHCDDCIAHHVYDAFEAGATKEEIADALGVAVLMGGGASVVYATHAMEALSQFSEASDQ